MGKSLRYVKEFDFGTPKVYVSGYCRGGPMKKAGGGKVGLVMQEFKQGELHSGKNGPVVTNPKQAIAIAISESRRKK